jgi:uncharacterized protein (DUF58 family)
LKPVAAGDTRMGLRLAVLSLAIGMAAINTGNNLLYLMLALVLALAMVSAVAAGWSMRRVHVAPILPAEATRGEPFLIGAEVTGRFPLLPQTWVRVRIEGLPDPVELTVGIPGDAGRGVASARVTVDRRGLFEDLSAQALCGYPLDLALRRAKQRWRGRIVVLPRFDRISKLRITRGADGGRHGRVNAPSRRTGGTDAELRNIRHYTTRDDARHIDWRSSARTRQLMVREFEREVERRVDLVLDLQTADPAAFEAAVERCAAILDLARRRQFDARLLVPGLPAALSGREAMRCLAIVKPASTGKAPLETALRLTRREAELIVISTDPRCATPIEVV